MTAFLLDTSAVIGLIERRSTAVRGVLSRATVDPVVSILTVGELAHGVAMAGLDERERRRRGSTANQARRLPVLGISTAEVADCYGFVSASQRAGWIDRWLVASAVVHGLEVVTEDIGIARLVDDVEWTDQWRRPPISLCPTA